MTETIVWKMICHLFMARNQQQFDVERFLCALFPIPRRKCINNFQQFKRKTIRISTKYKPQRQIYCTCNWIVHALVSLNRSLLLFVFACFSLIVSLSFNIASLERGKCSAIYFTEIFQRCNEKQRIPQRIDWDFRSKLNIELVCYANVAITWMKSKDRRCKQFH